MKKFVFLLILMVFFVACDSSGKKDHVFEEESELTVDLSLEKEVLTVNIGVNENNDSIDKIEIDWGDGEKLEIDTIETGDFKYFYHAPGTYNFILTAYKNDLFVLEKTLNIEVKNERIIITKINSSDSDYDYNVNQSATYNLKAEVINEFINNEENFSTIEEAEKTYFLTAMNMVDENFAIDSGYFPKGKDGNFLLNVSNSSIDLSDYSLAGDLDANFEIDENDIRIMSKALANKYTDNLYDVNKDGIIDKTDLVFISSRLLTEAKAFSFYSEDNNKINLDDILVSNKGIIKNDIFSNYSKIRVIIRDSNLDGQIEAIDSISTKALVSELSFTDLYDLMEKIKNDCFIDAYQKVQDEYLCGWTFSLKAIDLVLEKGNPIKRTGGVGYFHPLDTSFNSLVSNRYFGYYMDNNPRFTDDYRMIRHLGYNKIFKGMGGTTIAHHLSYKNAKVVKVPDKRDATRLAKSIIHYSSLTSAYKSNCRMYGNVYICGWNSVNGKLRFKRLGPDSVDNGYVPFTTDYDVTKGRYDATGLPPGEYKIEFYVPGYKISKTIENGFVFEGEPTIDLGHDFYVSKGLKTIEMYIYENGKEPAVDVEVTLRALDERTGIEDSETVKTDENGKATLKEIPEASYHTLLGDPSNSDIKKKVPLKMVEKDKAKKVWVDPWAEFDDKRKDTESGWFDSIFDFDFGDSFIEWAKDFIAGYFNWNDQIVRVPDIYLESSYDIEFEYMVEGLSIAKASWTDIRISEDSTTKSELYNGNFAYVLTDTEDINPNTFNVELTNSGMNSNGEVNLQSEESILNIYKIVDDLYLKEYSPLLGKEIEVNYKKDDVYIELELNWSFAYTMADMPIEMPYINYIGVVPSEMNNEFISGYIPKEAFEKLTADDDTYSEYNTSKTYESNSYNLKIKVHEKEVVEEE